MGEIADAMLDGTLCQCCGVYMDKEEYKRIGIKCDPEKDGELGFPVTCADCKPAKRKKGKKS